MDATTNTEIPTTDEFHQYVIVGAGLCGMYAIHRLNQMGCDAVALEAHDGIGGTWHKNRYPGCRFDSESFTYGYSFSSEILSEWNWTERFAAQPETRSYLNYVADQLNLRPNIRLGTRLQAATYDEVANRWQLKMTDGSLTHCQFLVSAVGLLSAPVLPRLPGIDTYQGLSLHTYEWPDDLDLTGKRVGVIGTGSTGVQVISAIADQVSELVVFQHKPNWCAPLNNSPIDSEEMEKIKASYDEIFARCAETPGGFLHGPDRRSFWDVPPEERRALWESLYAAPGFGIWLGNFREILMDDDANAEFSEFIAEKIRSRVTDPHVADALIPKDHGFGVQRVPMETRYYEAYNKSHVHLVDLSATPITTVNETGIQTSDQQYDLDVLVYATGFDAITGSFDRIDIRGVNGVRLKDTWDAPGGPHTYLGVQVAGFPNFFMLGGPHSASVATNFPRAIETSVEWVTDLFAFMRDNGFEVAEVLEEEQGEWTAEIQQLYQRQVLRKSKSWFTGINQNIEGRDQTRYLIYTGGAPRYRKTLADVAARGYPGFRFTPSSTASTLPRDTETRTAESRM